MQSLTDSIQLKCKQTNGSDRSNSNLQIDLRDAHARDTISERNGNFRNESTNLSIQIVFHDVSAIDHQTSVSFRKLRCCRTNVSCTTKFISLKKKRKKERARRGGSSRQHRDFFFIVPVIPGVSKKKSEGNAEEIRSAALSRITLGRIICLRTCHLPLTFTTAKVEPPRAGAAIDDNGGVVRVDNGG